MRRRPRSAALLVAGALAAASLVGAPAAAQDVDCDTVREDTPRTDTMARSGPLEEMLVPLAHRLLAAHGTAPGEGTVALLGTGARGSSRLDIAHTESFAGGGPPVDGSGTIAAGLVAGKALSGGAVVGVAPAARVLSVRVLDSLAPQEGQAGPTAVRVAAGLDWVADQARSRGVGVAVVTVAVPGTPELEAAVRRVQHAGVVVVAAVGDRPTSPADPLFARFAEAAPGEDAARDAFPAGYPGVVAVTAAADEESPAALLRSSATAVVAPTVGAVSVAPNGATCLVRTLSSGYAAALVGGVVALLRARFPTDTPEQIAARLLETADGASGRPGPVTGAGMVQPVEALTRELRPTRSGGMDRSRPVADLPPAVVAPRIAADRYAGSRRDVVWWGLVAGGGMVLAMLLRPVLARRGG